MYSNTFPKESPLYHTPPNLSLDSFTNVSGTCSSVSVSPIVSPTLDSSRSASISSSIHNHTTSFNVNNPVANTTILSQFIDKVSTYSSGNTRDPSTPTPFHDTIRSTHFNNSFNIRAPSISAQSIKSSHSRRSRNEISRKSNTRPKSSATSSKTLSTTNRNNVDSRTSTTDQHSHYVAALFSTRSNIGVGGNGPLDSSGGGNQTDCSDIGLCVFDLVSTKCIVSQYLETQSLSRSLQKLFVYPPTQILVPSSYYHPDKSEIAVLLESNLDPSTEIIPIAKSAFSSNIGIELLKSLALVEHVHYLESILTSKMLALGAIAALFAHIEIDRQLTFARGGVHFVYESIAGAMVIDSTSARDLELVHSQASTSSPSLFSVLNRCLTSMGTRLLRNTILQPPCILDTIADRHAAVDELFNAPELIQIIVDHLSQIPNLDRIISGFIHISRVNTVKSSELDLARILDLRKALAAFPPLRSAIKTFKHPILVECHTYVSQCVLDEMNSTISQWIEDDLVVSSTPIGTRNQRAFAVKSGVHGLLDVSRLMYSDTVSDIQTLVNDYAARYELPLRCVFSSATGGFAIEIKSSQLDTQNSSVREGSDTNDGSSCNSGVLPKVFVNVQHKRAIVQFTTLDIMKLNERVRESMAEIFLISDRILQDLMEQLRSMIGCLYSISESIAMIDMLCCFGRLRMTQSYVRPLFSVGMTVVSESRHPILEAVFNREASSRQDKHEHFRNKKLRIAANDSTSNRRLIVPNDVYLDIGSNIQIVTGANGVGKTVYLKQVALITIMAHIGCPVPATNAVVRITHQILSRMSLGDAILSNQSSFTVEMRDTAHILEEVRRGYEHVLEKSIDDANDWTKELDYSALVLIDELGRGTAPLEAVGLAFSIVEQLAHTHVFIVFATHFHNLFAQLQQYPNIVHLHLDMNITPQTDTEAKQDQLAYTHKIQDGPSAVPSGYGLQLAAAVGFPESVLSIANQVAEKVSTNWSDHYSNSSDHATETAWRKAFHEVLRRVVAIQMNPYLNEQDQVKGLIDLQQEMRPMFPGWEHWVVRSN